MTTTNNLTLFGSITSPYVRRLRIWLAENSIQYTFTNLNIFDKDEREWLKSINPTNKIPMIKLNNEVIFDSSVIQRYLAQYYQKQTLNWQQENTLTVINSANDSLVELLICQRSGLDTAQDVLFFNLQNERIEQVLNSLESETSSCHYAEFGYLEICLFCLLDWILFRDLVSLSPYPNLLAFHQHYANRASCINTAPSDA